MEFKWNSYEVNIMSEKEKQQSNNFCVDCGRYTTDKKITLDSGGNYFFFCSNCKKVWCLNCMTLYTQKSPRRTYISGHKGRVKCPECSRQVQISKLPKDLPFKQVREDKEWKSVKQDEINEILEILDVEKYSDVFENMEEITNCFRLIYIIENVLRRFIQERLLKEGYSQIKDLEEKQLDNIIEKRKRQEEKQRYLPERGEHDVVYFDFIELNKVFDNQWKIFKDYFEDQNWIMQRIKDIYNIRNRVSHNSNLISGDEIVSVKVYCKEILKQISKYL